MVNIKENISRVREEIASAAKRARRDAREVKLMGVTKYHGVDMMAEAAPYLDLIGENKVQEAAVKRGLWNGALRPWHMIGRLQRNKIRRALETFDLIESVDSLALASGMDRVLSEKGTTEKFPVFMEVNMSREEAKGGVAPEEAESLAEDILKNCPRLSLEGLMTVAEATDDEKILRGTFAGLRNLRDRLREATGLELRELSMGMSGDFAIAVEEGSTTVRVGSAIFGSRGHERNGKI